MNNPECSNEVEWLAFSYAAGELTEADAEQFELRLADDQAAREALARAVELTQVVAAAEAQCGDLVVPASMVRSDWSLRLSWMATGGVAALLLAVLWSGVIGPKWQIAETRFHSQSRQHLAMAWYETGAELASVRETGLWLTNGVSESEEAAGDYVPMDEGVDEAPSWLTAAVVSMSHDSGAAAKPADPSES
jgi:hypothetical protein